MVDGARGIRQAWPAAVVGGLVFAVAQFLCSNYVSVELTDIVAALLATGAIVLLLRVWQPSEPLMGDDRRRGRFQKPAVAGAEASDPAMEEEVRRRDDNVKDPPGRRGARLLAVPDHHRGLCDRPDPGHQGRAGRVAVDHRASSGPASTWSRPKASRSRSLTYVFNWLPAAGTLLLISGLITMAVLKVSPARAFKVAGSSLDQLKWAILTVAAVLALAYVMNQSGQTITMGHWAAGAGDFFAFLSSMIGWLGVAVTGSDTSSNALFGALQVTAAEEAGISPTLLAAANSSGGVLGRWSRRRTSRLARPQWVSPARRATCSVRCWAGASGSC